MKDQDHVKIPDQNGYFPVGQVASSNPIDPKAPLQAPPAKEQDLTFQPDFSKASTYINAEMSLHLEGPVPEDVYEFRKSQCMSCPERVPSERDEIGFCKACGCGTNKRAQLTIKLTMPKVTCPRGKFTEARGRHPRIIDRIRSKVITILMPRTKK
jgi:hypothetical protein